MGGGVTEQASWQDGDVQTIRELVADAADSEIRELLDQYARRPGIKKPVGYAISLGQSQLTQDLTELRDARAKAEARQVIEGLREGPPCPHGEPGGLSPHPRSGRPLCPKCRAETAESDPDISAAVDSLSEVGEDHPAGDIHAVTARPQSWTGAELLAQTFQPPRWAVEGLIPEGVTLLAGPPKIGKSWLALGLCVSVAAGAKALGSIGTVQGSALYLALEDTPRRLQSRLRQVLGNDAPPDGLTLAVQWPVLSSGGAELLAEWLEDHPEARLIVVDVFERIRGQVPPNTSAYTADYFAVRRVKELADRFGVAIVLIHHNRKVKSDDFLNEISGTLGLSGAADTIAGLDRSRGEHDGIFKITGRDVEENEYAMKFAADRGAWQLLGLAGDYALTDTRRQLLACLRSREAGATPKQLADATGLDHETVKKNLQRMTKDNQVSTNGHGKYYPPVSVPGVPET